MNVESAALHRADLGARIALWELDCAQGIVWSNGPMRDMLRLDAGHALMPLTQFLARCIPADEVTAIAETLANGNDALNSPILTHHLLRPDGSHLAVHTFLQSRFEAIGSPHIPSHRCAIVTRRDLRVPTDAPSDSDTSFRVWADTMPQMVWSTLPDGHHDYYNARWYEYTGVPLQSTDGEGWNAMFHPDDQDAAWERWRYCLKTGAPYEVEYRLRRHDGIYRWTLGRAMPIRDAAGCITRWIGTCTDINDQKEAAQVLARTNADLEILVAARSSDIVHERQILLLETVDRLRTLATAEEITAVATELMGHCLNVDRVCYFESNELQNTIAITCEWSRSGRASADSGNGALSAFGQDILKVLRSAKPLVVQDVHTDPVTMPHLAAYVKHHIRSMLLLPLVKDGKLVAGMTLIDDEARRWTSDEIALSEEIAERIWSAIVRVRAESALRSTAERREKMRELGQFQLQLADMLRQLTSPSAIFSTVSELTCNYLRVSRVLFGDFDLDRGQIVFHSNYTDGTVAHINGLHSIDVFGADTFSVVSKGTTWICADLSIDSRTTAPALWSTFRKLDIHAAVVVPLSRRGSQVNCLFVHHNAPRHWSAEQVRAIEDVAERTASAIDRVRAEESLRVANLRKDEFLAMLAHELRNPLAPIVTAARVIVLAQDNPALVASSAHIITRQARHMTSLVNDLLDVSRVTRGLIELEKSEVDLEAVIHDAVEQAQPLIQARRHRLDIAVASPLDPVSGDHKRLVQVLANLLSNAAKYTHEGGRIELHASQTDEAIMLRVSDNGIGMTSALIPDVFQLFSQAERSSDRTQGGLGLGLALVKSLVMHHDGTVEAKSDGIGCGSEFIVRLPRRSADLQGAGTAAS